MWRLISPKLIGVNSIFKSFKVVFKRFAPALTYFNSAADFSASKVSMNSSSMRNASSTYGQRHDKSNDKWNEYSMQFKAFAFVNNFKEALDEKFDSELPNRQDEELHLVQDIEKIKAIKKNSAVV